MAANSSPHNELVNKNNKTPTAQPLVIINRLLPVFPATHSAN